MISCGSASGIVWKEIEALLTAVGAEITEGHGSRIRIALNGRRAVFHRPHPQKEADKSALVVRNEPIFSFESFESFESICYDESYFDSKEKRDAIPRNRI